MTNNREGDIPSAAPIGPRPELLRSSRIPVLIMMAVALATAALAAYFVLTRRGALEPDLRPLPSDSARP